MNTKNNISGRRKSMWRALLISLSIVGFTFAGAAYAADISIGQAASNITSTFSNIAKLITAGSYVAGFGFSIGAIAKFKAHKEQPAQIPIGTPIALIFIAAALIFLPAIFGMTEQTIFQGSASTGTASGTDTFS